MAVIWSTVDVTILLDLLFAFAFDIQPLAHFAESGARLAGGMDHGPALGERDVFAP